MPQFTASVITPLGQNFGRDVQRVGGYDAYGTPNAPARMAALLQQQAPVPR